MNKVTYRLHHPHAKVQFLWQESSRDMVNKHFKQLQWYLSIFVTTQLLKSNSYLTKTRILVLFYGTEVNLASTLFGFIVLLHEVELDFFANRKNKKEWNRFGSSCFFPYIDLILHTRLAGAIGLLTDEIRKSDLWMK